MYVPPSLESLAGDWAGDGKLWFAGPDPEAEFASAAHVYLEAKRNVVCIAYSWSYEGEAQEGLLVLGVSAERAMVEVSWVDSWHMADEFMRCSGRLEPGQPVSASGSYGAPDSPVWGWRIAVEVSNDESWRLVMYNIPPGVGEVPAFALNFRRV